MDSWVAAPHFGIDVEAHVDRLENADSRVADRDGLIGRGEVAAVDLACAREADGGARRKQRAARLGRGGHRQDADRRNDTQ